MNTLKGQYFQRGSSDRHAATLTINAGNYRLECEHSSEEGSDLEVLEISDRVGNIQRRIRFPDGSVFVTDDNDSLDRILENTDHSAHQGAVLHQLESRWRWVAVALVITILIATVLVKWGLPTTSRYLAHTIPADVSQYVSNKTLGILDEWVLEDSELDLEERNHLMRRFHDLTASLDESDHKYILHFRKMSGDVPNAFALPSGDVVLTDALVKLSNHQQELDSVLLHEISHVEFRHSQQQVISSSIVSVVTAYLTGGLSGGEELLTGLPVFMMQQSYSRKFETQADDFAISQMLAQGMDPACFGSIMSRLGGHVAGASHSEEHGKEVMSFFSSHPVTSGRAEKARARAEQAGIKPVCN